MEVEKANADLAIRAPGADTADASVVSVSSDPLESPQGEENSLTPSHQHAVKTEKAQELHWKNLQNMIYQRARFSYAKHGNKLYVFGGHCQDDKKHRSKNKAEVFDLETNSWTKLPSMCYGRSDSSCAVVGENIYVMGGLREGAKTPCSECEVFNTKTKTWSTIPKMNFAKEKHSSAAIGDKIYVFGGYRGRCITEMYDTVACTWTMKSRMKIGRYSFASAVVNNKIFAIGGMKEFPTGKNANTPKYHRFLETMEEYDIEKDEWTLSEEKMRNRRCGFSAVVLGSTIKVLGGHDEKEIVTSIESFDTVQRKWSGCFIAPSRNLRKYFGAEVIGDHTLVVAGGVGDSQPVLDSTEKYSLPKDHTIELSTPTINTFSNIDPEQKAPDFSDVPRKRIVTPSKSPAATDSLLQQEGIKRKSPRTHSIDQESCARKNRSGIERNKVNINFIFRDYPVAKYFSGVLYQGYVKEHDELAEFWTVEYEDGDREEMDRMELQQAIDLYDKEGDQENSKKRKRSTKSTTETVKPIDLCDKEGDQENSKKRKRSKKSTTETAKPKSRQRVQNNSNRKTSTPKTKSRQRAQNNSNRKTSKPKSRQVASIKNSSSPSRATSRSTKRANRTPINNSREKQTSMTPSGLLRSLEQQADAKEQNISKLEEEEFGESQTGSLQEREDYLKLLKLEKQVYGEAQSGDIQERIEDLERFFSIED